MPLSVARKPYLLMLISSKKDRRLRRAKLYNRDKELIEDYQDRACSPSTELVRNYRTLVWLLENHPAFEEPAVITVITNDLDTAKCTQCLTKRGFASYDLRFEVLSSLRHQLRQLCKGKHRLIGGFTLFDYDKFLEVWDPDATRGILKKTVKNLLG
jgi:hypothetical protein